MKGSKKRWFEALEEAGLVDEPEGGWELPEGSDKIQVPTPGSDRPRSAGADRKTPPAPSRYLQERETVESPPAAADLDLAAQGEKKKERVPARAMATLDYSQVKPPAQGPSALAASKGGVATAPGEILGATVESPELLEEAMQGCFQLGDYSGALEKANAILAANPGDEGALSIKASSEEVLLMMYQARIGDLGRKPSMAVSMKDVVLRKLDHKTGFILSFVDGNATFEEIVDMSGLGMFETCRVLHSLLQQKIIV